ncbi:iron dicitrate transport regulator FecR [Actinobacteria bacterium SCGC AG-212-D09]|nr:iron dicitrate transport regulator FecR [Actinobacteria bacterium SCGC AG-212-D09]
METTAERSAAARLAELIRAADSVVALTGAGISVPSGIPDFRSPGTGLWANVDPMEVAHIDAFHRDPRQFWSFYGDRFQTLEDKLPNRAHETLAGLERAGLLDAVITQNVDRLHARAGSVELIEVHGSISHSVCLECSARYPIGEVRSRHASDPEQVPRCDCGSVLKPDVVLFGEYLPQAALLRAQQLAASADVLLCIGSSLEVYPVAQLPEVTLGSGGKLAILTQGPTPFDRVATVRMRGDVVAELDALGDALALTR